MKRCLAGLLALLLLPAAVSGQTQDKDPPHGLAWNRSGLPAVFPLQVKTRDGQDVFLTLRDIESDNAVMGAHIQGGKFFKLLVPPGTYQLQFEPEPPAESGHEAWRLPDPLTFEIRGSDKKAGHLVDITELTPARPDGAEIRPQSICQVLSTDFEPRFPSVEFDSSGKQLPRRPLEWSEFPKRNIRAFYCD